MEAQSKTEQLFILQEIMKMKPIKASQEKLSCFQQNSDPVRTDLVLSLGMVYF